MMSIAGDLTRERDQFLRAEMVPGSGRDSQAIPGCTAVTADRAARRLPLQNIESVQQHCAEFVSRQHVQLLLRIVKVVNVDDGEAEVFPSALDLVFDIPRF